ncbi:MAG: type III-A CRISPR-associated RAMP protein Csm5 [Oscillochloris sp.]|nr:type III-A CRISPR-associated RAMP protein Csm5 [Oscillochloris sp.]
MIRPVNRVFPLTITTLAPLHIDSGARLVGDVDFYSDGNTTYVLDSDVALDLVAQRWEADQLSPEAQLRKDEAALQAKEVRLRQRRERNIREISAFEEARPKDRRKAQQQEERLTREATQIKAALAELKERRAQLASKVVVASAVLPDKIVQSSGFRGLLETRLISLEDLRGRAELEGRPLVRYVIAGRPQVTRSQAEIYEQIKDVADRPYLPGSSLKGALRSALAWAYAQDVQPASFQRLSHHGQKTADDKIEADLFHGKDGPGPRQVGNNGMLRDVLRGLHVGDSAPSAGGLELLHTQVYPKGSPVAVEAIPANTVLRATLQVERYMFEHPEARQVLDFGPWPQRLAPVALAASCRQRAAALIAAERAFYTGQAPELARFYKDLEDRLAGLGPRAFMLAVGWGAGWHSKTLDDRLRADEGREREFVEVVRQYNLKKDRSKSERFSPGGLFPATRKLSYQGSRPWRPLGWLLVEIGEEGQP